MACITAQMNCVKIIESADELAKRLDADLLVVTVQPKKQDAVRRSADMQTLCRLASQTGHEISVRYSDSPAKSIAAAAAESDTVHIFTGSPAGTTDFIGQLDLLTGDIPISMVSSEVYCTFNLRSQYS